MDTIAQVGTISAYLSLSEGGFGKKGTNVGTIVEVGTISAYLSRSEGGCGPKLDNVGTIVRGFGPKVGKGGTIAAKIGPSGHYREWIWVTIKQSGQYRGPVSGQVGSIGGTCGPRVDLDTLPKGENGLCIDTIDNIKGSSVQRGLLHWNDVISPNDPGHPVETFI